MGDISIPHSSNRFLSVMANGFGRSVDPLNNSCSAMFRSDERMRMPLHDCVHMPFPAKSSVLPVNVSIVQVGSSVCRKSTTPGVKFRFSVLL